MAFTAQELKKLDEMTQRRNDLQTLMTMPGWKHLKAEFQRAAAHAYSQMINETSPHRAAVYMGTHYASANVAVWPEQEVEKLNMQIKMAEKSRG